MSKQSKKYRNHRKLEPNVNHIFDYEDGRGESIESAKPDNLGENVLKFSNKNPGHKDQLYFTSALHSKPTSIPSNNDDSQNQKTKPIAGLMSKIQFLINAPASTLKKVTNLWAKDREFFSIRNFVDQSFNLYDRLSRIKDFAQVKFTKKDSKIHQQDEASTNKSSAA